MVSSTERPFAETKQWDEFEQAFLAKRSFPFSSATVFSAASGRPLAASFPDSSRPRAAPGDPAPASAASSSAAAANFLSALHRRIFGLSRPVLNRFTGFRKGVSGVQADPGNSFRRLDPPRQIPLVGFARYPEPRDKEYGLNASGRSFSAFSHRQFGQSSPPFSIPERFACIISDRSRG